MTSGGACSPHGTRQKERGNFMASSTELGVEKTLVLLKLDAIVRGLVGGILARFENAALKIVGVKMRQLDGLLAVSSGLVPAKR